MAHPFDYLEILKKNPNQYKSVGEVVAQTPTCYPFFNDIIIPIVIPNLKMKGTTSMGTVISRICNRVSLFIINNLNFKFISLFMKVCANDSQIKSTKNNLRDKCLNMRCKQKEFT